ncbi:MAG: ribonuclease III [Parcubacteria group bacterium RIFCSPLOWO2_01_FULL_48_18]|nr:MAG: ribonuclease III [Parcubacteria group bacterium RIFCSPLOWO2_01_FULL_48_18]OHB24090.1 MAG: ribonuclease III [Parcubacteria group bacterium RIFCSPHIGHO2_02_FULL_48_10b]
MSKDHSQLESLIGYVFTDKDFLWEALTHRSYLNENTSWSLPHNERLEFLGDAVLELAMSRYLFSAFKEYAEGQLTSLRAALVNAQMLARVAKEIKLDDFVLLSRGEAKDIGRARETILANAVESLIGAIYLDSGLESASQFVEKFIATHLQEVLEKRLWKDPKSYLQEIIQEKRGVTPNYKVLEEWGPDHKKTFRVGVFFGDELIASGDGLSKQEAEIAAAQNALAQYNR